MKVEDHLISLWNGGEEKKDFEFYFLPEKKKEA
jgi:hypothetical protein